MPKETEEKKEDIRRNDNLIMNKFYDKWLIDFVKLLYENDEQKRPNAAQALCLFKQIQNNPLISNYNQISANNNQNNQNNQNISHNMPINNNQNIQNIPQREEPNNIPRQ